MSIKKMKKINNVLWLLMVLIMATSCKTDLPDFINDVEVSKGSIPELSLDTSSLNFASGSGSMSFIISSNVSWAISSDQNWCSISLTSGSGDRSITVSVEENTSITVRTAKITVKSEVGVITVSVTQSGADAVLSLDTDNLEFTSGNGSKMIKITSNVSWTISSDQNWCSISPTFGSGDKSITVSVEKNSSTTRKATITVKSETITKTLAVTQSGSSSPSPQTKTFTVKGVKFKMIAVEGGTFTMGATSEQGSDANDSEKPTHSVTLSSYSIGETEVTQVLWQAVMGSNPSYFSGSNRPVEQVSWNDCQDFISKLNAMTGENFRLPTEAEWEYAARGGNKSRGYKYAGSNSIDDVAWYTSNSTSRTHDVATKQSNELGLFDMSGNVWEWCSDWYGNYSSSAQTNPTGPSSGYDRVLRGGSWGRSAWDCRTSFRSSYTPSNRGYSIGFRLAL